MIIRDADAGDVSAIAAIQAASPEAAQWDPASYLDHDCRVATRPTDGAGGLVIGFLAVRQTTPGENEILNLAVDPAVRRAGVARALLEDALARTKGTWFLEVRASNTAAIRLYESAGFERAGRRPNYYQGPAEEAIVMRFFS